MLTIRRMTARDWANVAHIYQEGIETGLATFRTDIPTYEEWDATYLPFCRLVAEEDGTVLGWVALSRVSTRCSYSGVCEVSIYISSTSRRKGVGKALLDAVILQSEIEGIWTLQSGILEDNSASIRLHASVGFRMVGFRERIGKDRHGIWRNTVLMERRCAADDVGACVSPCCQ